MADLVVGPVCKNLVRIFQLSEQAKKGAAGRRSRRCSPRPVAPLALVGAGVMGGGIAELASRTGIEVRMRDVQPDVAHARAPDRARR